MFFALAGTFALFSGHMESAEYIAVVGLVLGLYGGANVMEVRNGG